ncbi:hypothetical protein [Saccharothrix longispora]|uniref:hypothetical protein n=1 Tax=Saccharothrix longispora TaxID=33920 RepID=UPI0028FD9F3B|nr:hypothetical protein [Saccharothrix longispora]MBY8847936.1 hypothetical protein [Saccharothrix sp. MB29]MDU0288665.1 hypothetical protein [Saccharothrix longispora]
MSDLDLAADLAGADLARADLPGADLPGDAFGVLLRPFAEDAARVLDDVRRALADSGLDAPGCGSTTAPGRGLAAAWLDTLGVALDPFEALGAAGVGWLVEHVRFLRAPLDWLEGDGERIKEVVARWRQASLDLDRLARDRRDEVRAEAASRTCAAVADHVSTAGTVTAAVRGMVRDLVVTFAREAVRNAAVALASAEASGGASVAAFTAWAVGRAADVLERITAHVLNLLRAVARILGRLEELAATPRDR